MRVLDRIIDGKGRPEDIAALKDVSGKIMGNVICGLGDAATIALTSAIDHYEHEFMHYVEHGCSIFDRK